MKNLARISWLCLPILLSDCGGSQPAGSTTTVNNLLVTPIDAVTIAYDSKRDLIYASSGSRGAVIAIAPATGKVVATIGNLGVPNHLSVSSDGTYLYADTSGGVQKFNLATNTPDQVIPDYYVNSVPGGSPVQTLVASPVDPNTVASASYFMALSTSGQYYPLYIAAVHTSVVDGAELTPALGMGYTSGLSTGSVGNCGPAFCPSSICFSNTGSTLYCTTFQNDLIPFSVSTGATPPAPLQLSSSSVSLQAVDANGKLIVGGMVFSESTLTQIGHFGTVGSFWRVAPVPNANTAYGWCPAQNGAQSFFAKLNTDTYQIVKSWPATSLPNSNGANVLSLIYAGPNRFAFITPGPTNEWALMIFTEPLL